MKHIQPLESAHRKIHDVLYADVDDREIRRLLGEAENDIITAQDSHRARIGQKNVDGLTLPEACEAVAGNKEYVPTEGALSMRIQSPGKAYNKLLALIEAVAEMLAGCPECKGVGLVETRIGVDFRALPCSRCSKVRTALLTLED